VRDVVPMRCLGIGGLGGVARVPVVSLGRIPVANQKRISASSCCSAVPAMMRLSRSCVASAVRGSGCLTNAAVSYFPYL
jgi:hypothetical protein